MSYIKQIVKSGTIALLIAGSQLSNAQGIPVFDYASVTQSINQLKAWSEQKAQMVVQIDQQFKQLSSMNGKRNWGSLAQDPNVKNYLPQTYDSMLKNGVGNSTDIRNANRVATNSELGLTPGTRDYDRFEAQAQQAANNRAAAEMAYNRITQRFANIQALTEAINQAEDAKDVADLQARLQVELVGVNNEQNQLQALAQLSQSQKDLISQQIKEEQMKPRAPLILKH